MRKYLCLLLFMLLSVVANAQTNTLATFNLRQNEILKIGMIVLGGWALLNILIGSFRLMKATRNKRFFFQMNIYWNIVNMIIASVALYSLLTQVPATQSLAESIKLHDWYKKILYLNIGLDVAYLFLGQWLKVRSKTSPKTEQLLGWGQSIVLQGLFLLVLDIVLATMLENRAAILYSLIP
ncbi:DUF6992 family protein [Pontibacter pudoricolor]|uniref:DUF6992 family protein n=1 Tax=Pontibacter pudoricolor TaxID=2694930 RepID=UPI001EE4A029|nr:hypothetical protein [Pontibacter pudoricolor]